LKLRPPRTRLTPPSHERWVAGPGSAFAGIRAQSGRSSLALAAPTYRPHAVPWPYLTCCVLAFNPRCTGISIPRTALIDLHPVPRYPMHSRSVSRPMLPCHVPHACIHAAHLLFPVVPCVGRSLAPCCPVPPCMHPRAHLLVPARCPALAGPLLRGCMAGMAVSGSGRARPAWGFSVTRGAIGALYVWRGVVSEERRSFAIPMKPTSHTINHLPCALSRHRNTLRDRRGTGFLERERAHLAQGGEEEEEDRASWARRRRERFAPSATGVVAVRAVATPQRRPDFARNAAAASRSGVFTDHHNSSLLLRQVHQQRLPQQRHQASRRDAPCP